MCGIVGLLCVEAGWDVKSVMYQGLLELLNRGYDSLGISYLVENDGGDRHLARSVQKDEFFRALEREKREFRNGIAHTRWATHGEVSERNAHPHVDTLQGNFALVHNGIIENFQEHRAFLTSVGVTCRSDTDSEVIVNLVAYFYSINEETNPTTRVENSIRYVLERLHGTYGLVLQMRDFPTRLYCARKGSPLLLGITTDKRMGILVSEKSAFGGRVVDYLSLLDNSLHRLEILGEEIIHESIGADRSPSILYSHDHDPGPPPPPEETQLFFSHGEHTLREIFEQPQTIQGCLRFGARFTPQGFIKLGGLEAAASKIRACTHFYFLGCGTSYHAAQISAYFFRKWTTSASVVLAMDGSEFSLTDLPRGEHKTCCVFITQSGETLDLYTVLQSLGTNVIKLGIVNVVDSMIARSVDAGVYMGCGKERGVASTKTFTSSVLIGWLMAHWVHQTQFPRDGLQLYNTFHETVHHFLHHVAGAVVETWTTKLLHSSSLILLGRGLDYFIAREGALKIKELCYLHAEAFPSGALKHGPFALLDANMHVIVLMTSDPETFPRTRNAIHEIRARGSTVLLLTSTTDVDTMNVDIDPGNILSIPEHPWSLLLASMVLQLLAVRLSIAKGINPDFPRNLAKTVTVE